MTHALSTIRTACLSVFSSQPYKHLAAITSGISLVAALATASFPAAAYQFESVESSALINESATATIGCGHLAAHTGVFNLNTTDGLGKTRTFLVQVPADYNPVKPYALTFVFHGAAANSSQSYSWGLQNVTGASEAGIFVFPDGVAFKNYGVGWDDTTHGYDMPFFDNMVKKLETSYCVNSARVFAAGFSWGGDFVTALTCTRGNVLRAAAVNSSTDEYNNRANYLTYQDLPCPSTIHPPVRFEHAVGGDGAYPAPDFATTSKLFQSFNACSAATTPAKSSSVMACVSHNSCQKEFIDCAFNASIGHTLPPNWAADTWAFFQTFP